MESLTFLYFVCYCNAVIFMTENTIDMAFIESLDEKMFSIKDWRLYFKDGGATIMFITKEGKRRTFGKVIGLDEIEYTPRSVPKYVVEHAKRQVKHCYDSYNWANSEYSIAVGELREAKEKSKAKRKVNSFY